MNCLLPRDGENEVNKIPFGADLLCTARKIQVEPRFRRTRYQSRHVVTSRTSGV